MASLKNIKTFLGYDLTLCFSGDSRILRDSLTAAESKMLHEFKMRVAQIRDLAQSNGWRFVLKEAIYLHRTAIVVEKDLSEVPNQAGVLAAANLKVVEIDWDLLKNAKYEFALESRRLKAFRNLKRGYGGAALVRDNRIIGDTWYWRAESTDNPSLLHADLRRFGFRNWSKNYVYTFDIFVVTTERKGGISAAFQNSAMLQLREKGFTKGYGFYWADNVAAHWCTRVTNKWKKLREVRVNRLLIFTWVNNRAENRSDQTKGGLSAIRNS